MEKEEFEKNYIKGSNFTLEQYHIEYVTLQCSCDYENCAGWAAVSNNPLSIKSHNNLYKPTS